MTDPRRIVAVLDPDGRLEHESGGAPDVIWWSVTKPAIAAAALRLVAEGRLALDAPLPGEAFTLRQLLAHRSGLGDYGALSDYHDAVARADPPWTFAEMRARVEAGVATQPPRAQFRYSNLGYAIVARLIAQAADRPLGDALRRLVLEPLGVPQARLAATPGDLASTALPPPPGYDPGHVHHGVIVGSATDAARFVRAYVGGGLLPAPLAAAIRACEPLDFGGPLPGRPWTRNGYGLGLMDGAMRDPASGREIAVVGHSAGGPGSTGAVYHGCESGRTVAVYTDAPQEGRPETDAVARLCA